MPKLPGEPRLQLSEGYRACGGGAIRQKDYLAGWSLIVWTDTHFLRPWIQARPSIAWRGHPRER
jgi:hypothetical protein